MAVDAGAEIQVYSNIGERLYMRPEKADVYFIFESGERVPAHKLLLSSASDVFETMFNGSLKEEGDIKIVDASIDAFKEFLRFFYFNKIVLTVENVADLMYLGTKYDVKECVAVCAKLLMANITTDNVTNVLGLAIMYDQKEMLASCESQIRSNTSEVLRSSRFSECERPVFNHILRMDGISGSATDVFAACMSWVKGASKQDIVTRDIVKTHLGELFYALPFGSMTMAEFVNLLPSYGHLFSGEEYNEILQVISGRDVEPRLFTECRISQPSWNEEDVVVCNRAIGNVRGLFYIGTESVTKFSTNSPLLLGYFRLFPMYRLDRREDFERTETMKVDATILANRTEVLTQFSFDYNTCSADADFVRLTTPITIKSEIRYEIRLSFPMGEYCSYQTVTSTVHINDATEVEFFDDPVVKGEKFGLIEELGFNLLK